jgi:hypothetical protein
LGVARSGLHKNFDRAIKRFMLAHQIPICIAGLPAKHKRDELRELTSAGIEEPNYKHQPINSLTTPLAVAKFIRRKHSHFKELIIRNYERPKTPLYDVPYPTLSRTEFISIEPAHHATGRTRGAQERATLGDIQYRYSVPLCRAAVSLESLRVDDSRIGTSGASCLTQMYA